MDRRPIEARVWAPAAAVALGVAEASKTHAAVSVPAVAVVAVRRGPDSADGDTSTQNAEAIAGRTTVAADARRWDGGEREQATVTRLEDVVEQIRLTWRASYDSTRRGLDHRPIAK